MAIFLLVDGIVSEILYRLPTKIAYRLAGVCQQWRAVLSQPTFLCRHLSPPALPLLDGRPYAVILQPQRKVGFTDLRLVATDPTERVPVNVPLKPEYAAKGHAPEPPAAANSSEVKVDDYVVFFERTVQTLDISIVASHGRLLLCRSPSRYYVCDPAANRWLPLPPSTVSPSSAANSGLHYDVDASTGRFGFTIVLVARRRRRRVLAETFLTATGRWATREHAAPGVARCLPAKSPDIHVGTCFYWLSRRWHGGQSRIIRYDAALCRASLLREPPLAEEAKRRLVRSLGSVGGRLRLCAFDLREDSGPMSPDGRNDVEAVHGVWLMDAASAWRRVHEAVVEASILLLVGREVPLDFASACGEFIVLEKLKYLLRYDLESGSKVELADLEIGSCRRNQLYHRYKTFPFFK